MKMIKILTKHSRLLTTLTIFFQKRNVFYHFKGKFDVLRSSWFVSCKYRHLGQVWNILSFDKELTNSLKHHFETIPDSKKLQTTTKMWQLKNFKIQKLSKHCGKRWIAYFEQFHLFPQCFPIAFFINVLKWVYIERRVKHDRSLIFLCMFRSWRES